MATLSSVPVSASIPRVVADAAYDGLRDAKDRRIAALEERLAEAEERIDELERELSIVLTEAQSYRLTMQAALDLLRAEQLRAGHDRRRRLEMTQELRRAERSGRRVA